MIDHNLHELLQWLTGVGLLYPELHYVFRHFPFSRYFVREPEIVFDAPFRVEPGCQLPVMLLIKDADQYPAELREVVIEINVEGSPKLHFADPEGFKNLRSLHGNPESLQNLRGSCTNRWSYRIFDIDIPEAFRGKTMTVDCHCRAVIAGRERTIRNDNFPGLSHAPLRVFAAQDPLPTPDGWRHGDLHYHTEYTTDQVEFGAPLAATVAAAKALGLQFLAATDHSYDLDDMEGDFLHNDPDLRRWKKSREEISEFNRTSRDGFTIIPGEEVTCANAEGRNVHLLVLNEPSFLPGSGDGAEKWSRTRSEMTIAQVLQVMSPGALAMAAHPHDPAPWLEKWLIRRGRWEAADNRLVSHVQILNGLDNGAFREGIRDWIRRLCAGERVFIAAGNDAHGNFNRFRQVRTPMLALHEKWNHQRLGWARTCVRAKSGSVADLIEALSFGQSILTTGPVLNLTIRDGGGKECGVGETAMAGTLDIRCDARSTAEFGRLTGLTIYAGTSDGERVLAGFEKSDRGHEAGVQGSYILERCGHVRAEVRTETGAFCYSNPIWLTE